MQPVYALFATESHRKTSFWARLLYDLIAGELPMVTDWIGSKAEIPDTAK
jgi:hypothetical protein